MEREHSPNIEELLQEKRKHTPLSIRERLNLAVEVALGTKHRAGTVVHITTERVDPSWSIVYFDAGRRHSSKEYKDGIILEGVYISTKRLVELGVRVGDLVKMNYFATNIDKIASQEKIDELQIKLPFDNFEWKRVVGVLEWAR